jgi:hypothetical protein
MRVSSVDTKVAGGVDIRSYHVKATTFLAPVHSQKSAQSLRPRCIRTCYIDCQWQAHDDGTSAQQKQQPKELLFVLALAMVNVDDLRAEKPSISTNSLVCSS